MSIYLAGPDVFYDDAKGVLESKKNYIIERMKSEAQFTPNILTPIDNDLSKAEDIFASNIKLIMQSNIVLANIEPFRGPSLDPGTAFEIGFAYALGIGVYCYSKCDTPMLKDRLTNLNDKYLIEDFGLTDNLMIPLSAKQVITSPNAFEEIVDAIIEDYLSPENPSRGKLKI